MSTIATDSTAPYRIAKTRYALSDVSDFPPPSHHNHNHHHHHHDYDDDYYGYADRRRFRDNVPDDNASVISVRTKSRVRDLDPNKGRCLVENTITHSGIVYCYCFPPHAAENDPGLLDSVEWFWNMEYYTLNLKSSRNIFRVGASIERLYQKHFWLLLPEEDIVNQYHNALTEIDGKWTAHRETFPIIPDRNNFQYHFIAISNTMQQIAIGRQINHPDQSRQSYAPPTPDDFIISVYPFSNMPLMTCHVHPKYALLEAGRKLTKRVKQQKLNELLEEYPLLKKVVQIYGAWTAKRPDNAMDDITYYTLQRPERDEDKDVSMKDST